jgi:serine O-acetyltransferase
MIAASRRLLATIQAVQYHRSRNGPWHVAMRKFARARHLFWSIITQSDIDPRARLGQRLMLPHPNGVVIHEDAVIGDDCMIMQQVTIGMIGEGEVPTIGNRVYIGAGAKIIGRVTVGDGARIGANAVVTEDVPANWTAVGVPAKLIPPRSERKTKMASGRRESAL